MTSTAATKDFDLSLPVFQLKITLRDIEPTIWRRIQTHDCTLADLHEIIQSCMGWGGEHLYAFEVGRKQYTDLSMGGKSYGALSSRSVRLSDVLEQGNRRFVYEYDFGDSWRHAIEIEQTLPAEEHVRYPHCVDGRRACPPDDCGGSPGYYGLLEALANPDDEENAEQLEGLGDDFDPEEFSVDRVNGGFLWLRGWLGRRQPPHAPPTRFAVGDRIRVKRGVLHSRYTDIPLGGWIGTVEEIAWLVPIGYRVRWAAETLAAAHPVYGKRCRRDAEKPQTYWLVEAEIEADSGEPLEMEQPTNLVVKPLSAGDQDDRVRMALGRTNDDPLPVKNEEADRHYLEYLKTHLTFPFQAKYWPDSATASPSPASKEVTAVSFASPPLADDGAVCEVRCDEQTEQVALAKLFLDEHDPNYQYVDDYRYWRWEVRDFADLDDEDDEEYADDSEEEEEYCDEDEDDEEWEYDEGDFGPLPAGDRESEYSGPQPIRRDQPPVGRNDPCPCGSGKKFKKCCLKKPNAGLLE
jgi:hypothetical protein